MIREYKLVGLDSNVSISWNFSSIFIFFFFFFFNHLFTKKKSPPVQLETGSGALLSDLYIRKNNIYMCIHVEHIYNREVVHIS